MYFFWILLNNTQDVILTAFRPHNRREYFLATPTFFSVLDTRFNLQHLYY